MANHGKTGVELEAYLAKRRNARTVKAPDKTGKYVSTQVAGRHNKPSALRRKQKRAESK